MKKFPPGYLFYFLTLVFVVGCKDNNNGKSDGDYVISGRIEGGSQSVLFLEELTPTDIIALDTIKTDDQGYFKYSMHIDHSGFYRLRGNNNDFITLAAEPNQKIQVNAQYSQLRDTYTVSGSEGSVILWELNKSMDKGLRETDSLRAIFREYRHNPSFKTIRKELKLTYDSVVNMQREFVINTINNHPNSLASILALYQYFEDNLLLSETEHFEYYEKLSRSLCQSYPHNKHVINLKKRVNDIKRAEQQKLENEKNLAAGNLAPDIRLSDPQGNQISLSSLRGNVVLIDFWAAWCPPCREANILLKDLYQTHHSNGFEIYAISLDRTRDQWLNAIKHDNITWTQVSDLRFMNSPVVSLYNVTEVPHYVLIDRQGKIISRNFNINELESLLAENL